MKIKKLLWSIVALATFPLVLHSMESKDLSPESRGKKDKLTAAVKVLINQTPQLDEGRKKIVEAFLKENETTLKYVRTFSVSLTGKTLEDNKKIMEEERQKKITALRNIPGVKVYYSHGNYILKIPNTKPPVMGCIAGDSNTVENALAEHELRDKLLNHCSTDEEKNQVFKEAGEHALKDGAYYQAVSRLQGMSVLALAIASGTLPNVKTTAHYALPYHNSPGTESNEESDNTHIVLRDWVDLSNTQCIRFDTAEGLQVLYNLSPAALTTLLKLLKQGRLWSLSGNIFIDNDGETFHVLDLERPNCYTSPQAVGLDNSPNRASTLVGFHELLEASLKNEKSDEQAKIIKNYLSNLPDEYKNEGYYTGTILPILNKIEQK